MSSDKRYMESLCFRLKLQGLSLEEIAKETGLTLGQVEKKIEGYKSRKRIPKAERVEVASATGEKLDLSSIGKKTVSQGEIEANSIKASQLADTAITGDDLGNINDTLSKESDYFTLPEEKDKSLFLHKDADRQRERVKNYIENKYKGKAVKVLYLADLHIPFTMYDLVKHIIEEHKDADVLVINGDMLDLFAVSTFAKDKTVALKRELEEGREFLEIVSKIFGDVILIEGNHERRLRNYIKHIIPVDMHFLFPQDPLEVIQQGRVFGLNPLDNVHVVGSWWINLWDAIIGHPDNYSSVTLRTSINTSEHFTMVKHIPHRATIIGHTHQAGKFIDRGRMVMETGCLNYDMDYRNGSKFIKTSWTRAHAVLHFDDEGQISFNDSELNIFSI